MIGSRLETYRDAGSGYKPTKPTASGTTAYDARRTATVDTDPKTLLTKPTKTTTTQTTKPVASGTSGYDMKKKTGSGSVPNTTAAISTLIKQDVAAGGNTPKTTPTVSGSSYTPKAPIAPPSTTSGSGGSYTPNTTTTRVTETAPTITSSGFDSGNSARYTDPEAPPSAPQVPMTEEQQQMQSEAITSVDSIMSGYQQLQTSARSMGDEALVALAAQWDKMSSMLDGIEAQIVSQIKGQMSGDDPAMQNAIKLIRDEADRMRKETLDELNARGLVQSGVYARALSDMNNNELTQVQTAVASRFGDLQTQLNNAIMSLAQTRISALSANQSAVTSMMTNTQNNVLNTGLAGLNTSVTLRGQDMQDSQFNKQLSQNQSQFDKTLGYNYAQLGQNQNQFDSTMKYNYAGLNQNQSQYDTTMKYNYANLAQDQSQFNSTLQLNKEQLAQSSQQFYAQLNQSNKQFYDKLSSDEKMQYAQINASGGTKSATDTLEQQKFEWEKSTYNKERQDSLNASNTANTYTQVGNAMSPGGFVESAIKRISSGSATVDQMDAVLRSGGYTAEARTAIMNMIKSDPGVQKVMNPTKSTSSYTPNSSGGIYSPPYLTGNY